MIAHTRIRSAQFKGCRKSIGWSQARLARELEVHPMTISRWETGAIPVSRIAILAVQRIAALVGRL